MNDALGKRMKENYEHRSRYFLPRRSYTIIRLDGKSFHTLTKNCTRPFDSALRLTMQATARELCKEIQGACLAYTQSDEITVVVTDFSNRGTEAWFDNNLQKMCSVSASIATAAFATAKWRIEMMGELDITWDGTAIFDSRVFQIPDRAEVLNNLVWRQADASRNSIQMAARAVFSHKECNNKNTSQLQDMLHEVHGINWNDYTPSEKRGTIIRRSSEDDVQKWIIDPETPIFSKDRAYLENIIPVPGYE